MTELFKTITVLQTILRQASLPENVALKVTAKFVEIVHLVDDHLTDEMNKTKILDEKGYCADVENKCCDIPTG